TGSSCWPSAEPRRWRRDTPTVHSLWTRETGQLSRETTHCRMVVAMRARFGTRRPRWRCGFPDCPASKWQPVLAVGEYDPMDVALEELERHYEREHRDKGEKAS